jgi:hypothetical protein
MRYVVFYAKSSAGWGPTVTPGVSLSCLTDPPPGNTGEYFSEDAMRRRAPELYQEYVGQYLTQSEKNDAIQRDRDRAAAEGGPVQGRVLSDFFMRALGMVWYGPPACARAPG